jgi:hypothetical protein
LATVNAQNSNSNATRGSDYILKISFLVLFFPQLISNGKKEAPFIVADEPVTFKPARSI